MTVTLELKQRRREARSQNGKYFVPIIMKRPNHTCMLRFINLMGYGPRNQELFVLL